MKDAISSIPAFQPIRRRGVSFSIMASKVSQSSSANSTYPLWLSNNEIARIEAKRKANDEAKRKSNTPKASLSSKSKANRYICPVCDEVIMDGRKGHESIHCDGFCQQWFHRKCAGLSKTAFEIVSAPDYGPYFCCNCRLDALSKEIVGLKDSVSSLTSELQNIKASMCLNVSIPKLSSPQPDQHKPKGCTSNTPHPSPSSFFYCFWCFLDFCKKPNSSDTFVFQQLISYR